MNNSPPVPQRASIFSTPADAETFKPKPRLEARPTPEEIDELSSPNKFSRRDAVPTQPSAIPAVDHSYTVRKPMVYRTGRNVTISVKTTSATVDLFYAIATENGWKAGETFEKAIAALAKETGRS